MIKKHSTAHRWIAAAVAVCFILTNLAMPAYAENSGMKNFSGLERLTLTRFSDLQVPLNIGKLEDRFQADSGTLIVLVQDAHAVPEAQRNIRNLIDFFQRKYGVSAVLFEGSSERLNPQIFKSFPDPEILKKVFRGYLERGELTGPAMAAIFNENEAVFQGLEEWPLYEEGYADFIRANRGSEEVFRRLRSREAALEREKQKYYSPALRRVDRALRDFTQNYSQLIETLEVLQEFQKPAGESEMALLLEARDMEFGAPVTAEAEVKDLAKKIQRHLTLRGNSTAIQVKLAEFNEKFQAFQTSRMTAPEFALALRELAQGTGLKFRVTKQLEALITKQKRMRDIEGTRFFDSFETYAAGVKESLFQGVTDRLIDRESHRLGLLKKLAALELTHPEWEELRDGGLFGQAGDEASVDPRQAADTTFGAFPELGDLLEPHFSFYRNAEARDEVFFQKISGFLRAPQSDRTDSVNLVIAVAGGFHTAGLTRLFRGHGVSYVQVSPEIGYLPRESFYRSQMEGNVSWAPYFREEQGTVDLYKAFVRAARDRLLGEARNQGALLKQWRDQLIRDLSRRGRVSEVGRYTRFMDEAAAGENNAVQTALLNRAENFIQGLRLLSAESRLTEQNIFHLLVNSGIQAPATANVIAEGGYLHASVKNGRLVPQDGFTAGDRRSVNDAFLRAAARSRSELRLEAGMIEEAIGLLKYQVMRLKGGGPKGASTEVHRQYREAGALLEALTEYLTGEDSGSTVKIEPYAESNVRVVRDGGNLLIQLPARIPNAGAAARALILTALSQRAEHKGKDVKALQAIAAPLIRMTGLAVQKTPKPKPETPDPGIRGSQPAEDFDGWVADELSQYASGLSAADQHQIEKQAEAERTSDEAGRGPKIDRKLFQAVQEEYGSYLRDAWQAYAADLTRLIRQSNAEGIADLLEKVLNIYFRIEINRAGLPTGEELALWVQGTGPRAGDLVKLVEESFRYGLVNYFNDPLKGQSGSVENIHLVLTALETIQAKIARGESSLAKAIQSRLIFKSGDERSPGIYERLLLVQKIDVGGISRQKAAEIRERLGASGGKVLGISQAAGQTAFLTGPRGQLLLTGPGGSQETIRSEDLRDDTIRANLPFMETPIIYDLRTMREVLDPEGMTFAESLADTAPQDFLRNLHTAFLREERKKKLTDADRTDPIQLWAGVDEITEWLKYLYQLSREDLKGQLAALDKRAGGLKPDRHVFFTGQILFAYLNRFLKDREQDPSRRALIRETYLGKLKALQGEHRVFLAVEKYLAELEKVMSADTEVRAEDQAKQQAAVTEKKRGQTRRKQEAMIVEQVATGMGTGSLAILNRLTGADARKRDLAGFLQRISRYVFDDATVQLLNYSPSETRRELVYLITGEIVFETSMLLPDGEIPEGSLNPLKPVDPQAINAAYAEGIKNLRVSVHEDRTGTDPLLAEKIGPNGETFREYLRSFLDQAEPFPASFRGWQNGKFLELFRGLQTAAKNYLARRAELAGKPAAVRPAPEPAAAADGRDRLILEALGGISKGMGNLSAELKTIARRAPGSDGEVLAEALTAIAQAMSGMSQGLDKVIEKMSAGRGRSELRLAAESPLGFGTAAGMFFSAAGRHAEITAPVSEAVLTLILGAAHEGEALYDEIIGRFGRIIRKYGIDRVLAVLQAKSESFPGDQTAVRDMLDDLLAYGISPDFAGEIAGRIIPVNINESRLSQGEDRLGGLIVDHAGLLKILFPRQRLDRRNRTAMGNMLHELVEVKLLEQGVLAETAHRIASRIQDEFNHARDALVREMIESLNRGGDPAVFESRFGDVTAEIVSEIPMPSDDRTGEIPVFSGDLAEAEKNAIDHLRQTQDDYRVLKESGRRDEVFQRELRAAESRLAAAEQAFRQVQESRMAAEMERNPDAAKKLNDLLAKTGLSGTGQSPFTALETFVNSPVVQASYAKALLAAGEFEERLSQALAIADESRRMLELAKLGQELRAAMDLQLESLDPEIRAVIEQTVLLEMILSDPSSGVLIEFMGPRGENVREGAQADLGGRGRSQLIAAIGLSLGFDISAPTGIGKTNATRLLAGLTKQINPADGVAFVLENTDSESKYFKTLEAGKQYEGARIRDLGDGEEKATGVVDLEIAAFLGYQQVRASDYIGEGKEGFSELRLALAQNPKAVLIVDIFNASQLGNQFDHLSGEGRLDAMDLLDYLEAMEIKVMDEAQIPALHRVRSIVAKEGKPALASRQRRVKRGLTFARLIDRLVADGLLRVEKSSDVEKFIRDFGGKGDLSVRETPAVLLTKDGDVEFNRAATELLRKKGSPYGFRKQREFGSFIRAMFADNPALIMATLEGRLEQKPYEPTKGVEKRQQSSDIALQLGALYRFIKEHEGTQTRVQDVVSDLESPDNLNDEGMKILKGDERLEGIQVTRRVKLNWKKLGKWFNAESIGRLDTKSGTPIQQLFMRGVRTLSATLPLMNGLFTGNPLLDLGTSRPDLEILGKSGRLRPAVFDYGSAEHLEKILGDIRTEMEAMETGTATAPQKIVLAVPLVEYRKELAEKFKALGFQEEEIREVTPTTTSEDMQDLENQGAGVKFMVLGFERIATGRDFKGRVSVFGIGIEDFPADLLSQLIGRDRTNSGNVFLYASMSGMAQNLIQAVLGAEAGDFERFLARQAVLLEQELGDTRLRLETANRDLVAPEAKQKHLEKLVSDQTARLEGMQGLVQMLEALQRDYRSQNARAELQENLENLGREGQIRLQVQTGESAGEVETRTFSLADFLSLNFQYRYMMTQSHASRFIASTMARNEVLTRPLKTLVSRILVHPRLPESRKAKLIARLARIVAEAEDGTILSADTFLEDRVVSGEDFVRQELLMQLDFILGERLHEESILERLAREGFGEVWTEVEEVFRVAELRAIKRAMETTSEFSLEDVRGEASEMPGRFSIASASGRGLRNFFKTLVLFGDYVVAGYRHRQPASGEAESVHLQTAKAERNDDHRAELRAEGLLGREAAASWIERLKGRNRLLGRRVFEGALNYLGFLEQVKMRIETDFESVRGDLNRLRQLIEASDPHFTDDDCASAGTCLALADAIGDRLLGEGLFDAPQGQFAANRLFSMLSRLSLAGSSGLSWPDVIRALRSENPEAAVNRLLLNAGISLTSAEQVSFRDEQLRATYMRRDRETRARLHRSREALERKIQSGRLWWFPRLQYYFPGTKRIHQGFLGLKIKLSGFVHGVKSSFFKRLYEKFLQPVFGGKYTVRSLWDASGRDWQAMSSRLRAAVPEMDEGMRDLLGRRWDDLGRVLGGHFWNLSVGQLRVLIHRLGELERETGERAYLNTRDGVIREAYRAAFGKEPSGLLGRVLGYWGRRQKMIRRLDGLIRGARGSHYPHAAIGMLRVIKINVAETGYGDGGKDGLKKFIQASEKTMGAKTLSSEAIERMDSRLGNIWKAVRILTENVMADDGYAGHLTLEELRLIAGMKGLGQDQVWDLARYADRDLEAPDEELMAAMTDLGIGESDIPAVEFKKLVRAARFVKSQSGAAGRHSRPYKIGDFLNALETLTLNPLAIRVLAKTVGLDLSAQESAELLENAAFVPESGRDKPFRSVSVVVSAAAPPDVSIDERYREAIRLASGGGERQKLSRAFGKLHITRAVESFKSGDIEGAEALLDQAYEIEPDLGREIAELEFDLRIAGGRQYALNALGQMIEVMEKDLRENQERYLPEEIRGLEMKLSLLRQRHEEGRIEVDSNADALAYHGRNREGKEAIFLSRSFLIAVNQLRRDRLFGALAKKTAWVSLAFFIMHEETEGHLDRVNQTSLEPEIRKKKWYQKSDDRFQRLHEISAMIGKHRGANDLGKMFRDFTANLFEMYFLRSMDQAERQAVYRSFERLSALWGQTGFLEKISPYRRFAKAGKEGSPLELWRRNPDPAAWTAQDHPLRIWTDYFRENDAFGYIFEFRDAVRAGSLKRAQSILDREIKKNYDERGREKPEPNVGPLMAAEMKRVLKWAKIREPEARQKAVDGWWNRIEENALYFFQIYHASDPGGSTGEVKPLETVREGPAIEVLSAKDAPDVVMEEAGSGEAAIGLEDIVSLGPESADGISSGSPDEAVRSELRGPEKILAAVSTRWRGLETAASNLLDQFNAGEVHWLELQVNGGTGWIDLKFALPALGMEHDTPNVFRVMRDRINLMAMDLARSQSYWIQLVLREAAGGPEYGLKITTTEPPGAGLKAQGVAGDFRKFGRSEIRQAGTLVVNFLDQPINQDEALEAARATSGLFEHRVDLDEFIEALRELAFWRSGMMDDRVYRFAVSELLGALESFLQTAYADRSFTLALNIPETGDAEKYLDPVRRLNAYIGRLVVRGSMGKYGADFKELLGHRLNPLNTWARIQTVDSHQTLIPGITPGEFSLVVDGRVFGVGLTFDADVQDPRILTYAALLQMVVGIIAASSVTPENREAMMKGELLKKTLLRSLPLFQEYEQQTGSEVFILEARGASISLRSMQHFLTEYRAVQAVKASA